MENEQKTEVSATINNQDYLKGAWDSRTMLQAVTGFEKYSGIKMYKKEEVNTNADLANLLEQLIQGWDATLEWSGETMFLFTSFDYDTGKATFLVDRVTDEEGEILFVHSTSEGVVFPDPS